MNVRQEGLRKHNSKSVFYTEEDKPQLQRDPTETQSYIVTQKTRNILFGLLGLAFLVGAIYWIQTVKAAHAQNMFGSKETNRCCFLFNCRLLFIIFDYFYSLISSLTQFLSIRIVLPYFHLLIFYFEKILNLNLTFAICRIREA